jgi:hypothetical protein
LFSKIYLQFCRGIVLQSEKNKAEVINSSDINKESTEEKKKHFILSFEQACRWWRRDDLELKPRDIERVAQVLRQAGIKVYGMNVAGCLVCEPRPLGVREALSGDYCIPKPGAYHDYPDEEPGQVLQFLADSSVPICVRRPMIGWAEPDK